MSVYYVSAPDLGVVKIGFATDVRSRLGKMRADSPVRLVLLGYEDGDEAAEGARHAQFAQYRRRGEWFALEGELADHAATLPGLPPKIPSLTARLARTGISLSYASMIAGGARQPSRSLAVHIFLKTGWRHESIAELTDEQIKVLSEVDPWTPPKDRPTQDAA